MIKSGQVEKKIWPGEPNKAAQKDADARWTLKVGGDVSIARTARHCP